MGHLVDSGFTKENQSQIQEGRQIVKLTAERIRKMVLDILYYAEDRLRPILKDLILPPFVRRKP